MKQKTLEDIIAEVNRLTVCSSKFPHGFTEHGDELSGAEKFRQKMLGGGTLQPVAALIDGESANAGDEISKVVIAVGLDCGRIKTSRYGHAGMRQKLIRTYQRLALHELADGLATKSAVLIAISFFPWTMPSCQRINAIEEMLLLYHCGFFEYRRGNSFAKLTELVAKVKHANITPHLVFHGKNSSVPLLGRFALDVALSEEDRRSVVFCDSLDNNREIKNAVLLEDDRFTNRTRRYGPAPLANIAIDSQMTKRQIPTVD
jgi:hypothetical protein